MKEKRKRITIEFAKKMFTEREYTLLEDVYTNAQTHLKYICDKGHSTSVTWNNFKKGAGCYWCNGTIKPTYEHVKEKFEERGYTLKIKEYVNAKTKLKYLCSEQHECEITWDKFKQGKGCKKCSGNEKHTYEFVKDQFEKEGYKLLTIAYDNAHHTLKYLCLNGHKANVTYNKFKSGDRCRQCFFERNRRENHPNWNPLLTDEERIKGRDYPEYEPWRIAVFIRDNRKCQCCGSDRKIHAHHILNYSSNPNLRTVINNGITLCQKCHCDFHSVYGNKNNTKEQLDEYLLAKIN